MRISQEQPVLELTSRLIRKSVTITMMLVSPLYNRGVKTGWCSSPRRFIRLLLMPGALGQCFMIGSMRRCSIDSVLDVKRIWAQGNGAGMQLSRGVTDKLVRSVYLINDLCVTTMDRITNATSDS